MLTLIELTGLQSIKQQLTNWENILTTQNKNLINFEIPLADHLTRKFILNPMEDSKSAPTKSLNSQSWL